MVFSSANSRIRQNTAQAALPLEAAHAPAPSTSQTDDGANKFALPPKKMGPDQYLSNVLKARQVAIADRVKNARQLSRDVWLLRAQLEEGIKTQLAQAGFDKAMYVEDSESKTAQKANDVSGKLSAGAIEHRIFNHCILLHKQDAALMRTLYEESIAFMSFIHHKDIITVARCNSQTYFQVLVRAEEREEKLTRLSLRGFVKALDTLEKAVCDARDFVVAAENLPAVERLIEVCSSHIKRLQDIQKDRDMRRNLEYLALGRLFLNGEMRQILSKEAAAWKAFLERRDAFNSLPPPHPL